MGYNRGGGGGGYRGGGRGSRGGRGGGGGGRRGGGRGGRSRGGRGPRRGPRDPREAAQSGNQRERIAVESGSLVFIDQFMLANPQFVDLIGENIDSDVEVKEKIIRDYGGCVVSVEPGTYRIERDPFAPSIVVHREDTKVDLDSIVAKAESHLGRVYVDTRCLAMVDRELLDDNELLHKYQELWFAGEEKACRDLLRDNGGAVRYGFQRFGDELGIYSIPNEDVICLWPDVVEAIGEAAPPEAA